MEHAGEVERSAGGFCDFGARRQRVPVMPHPLRLRVKANEDWKRMTEELIEEGLRKWEEVDWQGAGTCWVMLVVTDFDVLVYWYGRSGGARWECNKVCREEQTLPISSGAKEWVSKNNCYRLMSHVYSVASSHGTTKDVEGWATTRRRLFRVRLTGGQD